MSMGYENATIGWAGPSTKLRTGAHQIQRTSERRSTEQQQSLARVGTDEELQMRKIEELILYVIDLEKKVEQKRSWQTKLSDGIRIPLT